MEAFVEGTEPGSESAKNADSGAEKGFTETFLEDEEYYISQ